MDLVFFSCFHILLHVRSGQSGQRTRARAGPQALLRTGMRCIDTAFTDNVYQHNREQPLCPGGDCSCRHCCSADLGSGSSSFLNRKETHLVPAELEAKVYLGILEPKLLYLALSTTAQGKEHNADLRLRPLELCRPTLWTTLWHMEPQECLP